MLTLPEFKLIFPSTNEEWLGAINNAMGEFAINTPKRIAMFIAQVAHESSQLRRLEENLNYSAERLVKVFPKYFPTLEVAERFARKPIAIANRIYCGRMGNKGAPSMDGWTFRGRGPIQLTGRTNYEECGKALKLPLTDRPWLLAESKDAGMRSAAWFFVSVAKCIPCADQQDLKACTIKINGGTNGMDSREMYYKLACSACGVN